MAYTDMTSEFEYEDLIAWVNLDALAENDSYDSFSSGTVAIFYQASAPTGWTKSAAQNNKALRVVSGSGGGSGGTSDVSDTITVAHVHAVSHTHSSAHIHAADSGALVSSIGTFVQVVSADSDGAIMYEPTGGSTTRRLIQEDFRTTSPTISTDVPDTDSQLADLALAYIDVIICSKDV